LSQEAQSQDSTGGGCSYVACLEVAANNGNSPSWPTVMNKIYPGSSVCGNGYCTWNVVPYRAAVDNGYVGALLTLRYKGKGGQWLTTYTDEALNGQFQALSSDQGDPFYTSAGTTSNVFSIQTGTNVYGYYLAQVSLVQPNGNGGYSAAFTLTWGWSWSASGVFDPIGPVVAPIWSSQSQNIGRLH
jgi:hypothetical protein